MKKIVGSTLDLSTKAVFSFEKIWVETPVFAIQHIGNRKKIYWSSPPPPPRDQTKSLAYSCSYTFHTSYKNGMFGHGGGGTLSKCSKTLYYKNLLETYFVKTCR